MSHHVLARKWRPQKFDDVLGQQAVTRTLENGLKAGRLAHAYVFSGPRGCGKTTTARILARALNCVKGPTPEPCGVCEPCVEIAEGRDIDVLEIDAATHTGVDNVREVIIEGLAIAPVRNRYKIFIIDEVHMLSTSSFNALLKSIEEPPPHVVFMMATTERHRIPDTVISRAQVHEFRTIPVRTIAGRLRHIATEEHIEVPDEALTLIARAGEGSMRDALSALDQVRAFAGDRIATEDVVTVLGLVGRDLVLDMLDAVGAEDAPAAFALAERAIERGNDLRLLCRELARALRDLLIIQVDRSRAAETDVAGEADRDRMLTMADVWSREDLLRGFDLLTRVEQDIRASDQPRFSLEMALLKLMHLRKLVPLSDLLLAAGGGAAGPRRSALPTPGAAAAPGGPPRPSRTPAPPAAVTPPTSTASAPPPAASRSTAPSPVASHHSKDALMAALKTAKPTFYNLVVAQAFRIDVSDSGVSFAFQPNQKVPKQQCEDNRAWLSGIVEQVMGRKVPVTVTFTDAAVVGQGVPSPTPVAQGSDPDRHRQEALAHETVRNLLDVFPVEKTTVREE
jgi:DNA polymerase-3 subunit gamma/tau